MTLIEIMDKQDAEIKHRLEAGRSLPFAASITIIDDLNNAIFHHDSPSPEEAVIKYHGYAYNYNMAVTRSKIRALIAAIHFAKDEPEYFPPAIEPVTSYSGPASNDEPLHWVCNLSFHLTKDLAARYIMNPYDWTHQSWQAQLDIMLSQLPPLSDLPA